MTVIKWAFSIGLLCVIGCCAWINLLDLADGFPSGLTYDRVLAHNEQYGLREGCAYIAYELSSDSADRVKRGGVAMLRDVHFVRSDDRNPYSEWQATPLDEFDNYEATADDTRQRVSLYTLGAASGCGGDRASYDADALLAEAGNYVSMSKNNEGLAILSPARRLYLFLYFG